MVYSLIAAQTDRYAVLAKNVQLLYEQKRVGEILAEIPFAVLKGTTASIYYPEPILRTLGDIDIIVQPENLAKAYNLLKANGYRTSESMGGNTREVPFVKAGVVIELHRSYAELNQKERELLLDQWIFDVIPRAEYRPIQGQSFPMLPDPFNGLVLLSHISQHLKSGLGLRQVLDWVMYVNKEVHDDSWPEFQEKTEQIGLNKLAKVTVRLGQLYLGLPEIEITWCMDTDEQLCSELLEYLFECGNFGEKLGANNTVTTFLSKGKGFSNLLINLQRDGENTWNALKRHPGLRPFGWIYQGIRMISRGKKQITIKELIKDVRLSKKRNSLMERLGVTQQAKRNKNT